MGIRKVKLELIKILSKYLRKSKIDNEDNFTIQPLKEETSQINTSTIINDENLDKPIIEEIIFRGIIQKGMINNGVKPRNAILVSALIFGIVHFNPWQFIGAFLLGIVLGVVYFKTKSLLMSIFLHFFNNTIAEIIMKSSGPTSTFLCSEKAIL